MDEIVEPGMLGADQAGAASCFDFELLGGVLAGIGCFGMKSGQWSQKQGRGDFDE